MYAFNVSVMEIMSAIKKSNLDIGAETMEINKVEYLIRGLGYIKNVKDIENAVVTVREGVPVRISDVAFVNIGPEPTGRAGQGGCGGRGRSGRSPLWLQPLGGYQ